MSLSPHLNLDFGLNFSVILIGPTRLFGPFLVPFLLKNNRK